MFQKLRIDAPGPEWLYIPDVEYKNYSGISRKLQMFVPRGTEKRYPLIVYLPGSAFYAQEMYGGVPAWGRLAARGYVVAALQYRESNIAKFPAQIRDVHNAITFLKTKADEFHIDPSRVFVMGHSSGGYNALMAGVTAGIGEFDGGANHRISGIAAFAAPSYLKYEVEVLDTGAPGYDTETYRPELDMLGLARFEDDMALFRRARVAGYITRDRAIPPILLFHGDRDATVGADNSRKLYKKLMEEGKVVRYYELEGQGHGGPWLWDSGILDITDEFLSEAGK